MTTGSPGDTPMFPLGTVLVPGGAMPLHVFEPRYRALARRCVDAGEPFGVVLIERGGEVGGGDVRTDVACLARIADYEEFPDGRWALIAVGEQRVRVEEWLPDDPFPRAVVVPWPDDDEPLDGDALGDAARRVMRVLAMAAEAGYQVPDLDVAGAIAGLDATGATFRLISSVPIGAFDRQALLCAPGPASRLELLHDVLDGVEAVLMAAIDSGGEAPS